jgi:TPR repeat protein
VQADRQQARAWFEKAAAAGNQLAIDRLAKIESECATGSRQGQPRRAPGEPPGRPPAGQC